MITTKLWLKTVFVANTEVDKLLGWVSRISRLCVQAINVLLVIAWPTTDSVNCSYSDY